MSLANNIPEIFLENEVTQDREDGWISRGFRFLEESSASSNDMKLC